MPIVLPAPGSATITCQERLCQAERSIAWNRRSKAVSMKMSFLKEGMGHGCRLLSHRANG